MAVSTTSGARLYIGTTTINIDDFRTMIDSAVVAYFEGLAYTEIEEIESLGELGDESGTVAFSSLKDQRERVLKTIRNAGTMAVVVGRDALDAGQAALIAAEKTDFNYAFKLVYDDARDSNFSDSIEYFGGKVLSRRTNIGAGGDVTKRTFNVAVNTAVWEVATES